MARVHAMCFALRPAAWERRLRQRLAIESRPAGEREGGFFSFLRRLIMFIFGWMFSVDSSDLRHAFFLLGDEHILGIGDCFALDGQPGVARDLVSRAAMSSTMRHPWDVVSLGAFSARSADWLPGTKLLSDALTSWRPRSTHDVVVLCLGFNDAYVPVDNSPVKVRSKAEQSKCKKDEVTDSTMLLPAETRTSRTTPVETFQHIRDICAAMEAHFAYIYVCTVPDWAQEQNGGVAIGDSPANWRRALNALLLPWLIECSMNRHGKIRLCARPDTGSPEYALMNLYCDDRPYFNDRVRLI